MQNKNWEAIDVQNVLKNVETIFKTQDSTKMTKKTYNVLYLMSGFIAHYDINGFIHHYSDVADLARDITLSMDAKDPTRYMRDSFFADQYGTAYCQSKVDVYTGLRDLAEQYLPELERASYENTKDRELAYANHIMQKYENN